MSIGLEILTKEERAAERSEGKRVGMCEGIRKGKMESQRLIARNASNMGFSADETAKLCDVSLDTMQEWFAEWDSEA